MGEIQTTYKKLSTGDRSAVVLWGLVGASFAILLRLFGVPFTPAFGSVLAALVASEIYYLYLVIESRDFLPYGSNARFLERENVRSMTLVAMIVLVIAYAIVPLKADHDTIIKNFNTYHSTTTQQIHTDAPSPSPARTTIVREDNKDSAKNTDVDKLSGKINALSQRIDALENSDASVPPSAMPTASASPSNSVSKENKETLDSQSEDIVSLKRQIESLSKELNKYEQEARNTTQDGNVEESSSPSATPQPSNTSPQPTQSPRNQH